MIHFWDFIASPMGPVGNKPSLDTVEALVRKGIPRVIQARQLGSRGQSHQPEYRLLAVWPLPCEGRHPKEAYCLCNMTEKTFPPQFEYKLGFGVTQPLRVRPPSFEGMLP